MNPPEVNRLVQLAIFELLRREPPLLDDRMAAQKLAAFQRWFSSRYKTWYRSGAR